MKHQEQGQRTIDEVLEERGETHGIAWKVASILFKAMKDADRRPIMIIDHMYFYAWIQIIGKLARIMYSPDYIEHWRDIVGYATLVLHDIEGEQ